ncbi:MAG: hypothetical protein ABW006_00510 [Hyphomicrobium sp.]
MNVIAIRFGVSAAADESPKADAATTQPISLAGRWTGQYYGYGRGGDGPNCGDTGCGLTYDIVACKDGWCGISVKTDHSCGAAGLHLAAQPTEGDHVFKGRLELAKGAAPYAVQAWHDANNATGAADLHFVGNTGSELLLFRRSYPFEANLTRSGDAICTLDKATS